MNIPRGPAVASLYAVATSQDKPLSKRYEAAREMQKRRKEDTQFADMLGEELKKREAETE